MTSNPHGSTATMQKEDIIILVFLNKVPNKLCNRSMKL